MRRICVGWILEDTAVSILLEKQWDVQERQRCMLKKWQTEMAATLPVV